VSGSEALSTLAEVAIGLAGFSGIATALRGSQLHPADVWRTLALLVISFLVLFLSLVPYAFIAFGFGDSTLWRVSSAFGFILLPASGIPLLRLRPPDFSSVPYHYLSPYFGAVNGGVLVAFGVNLMALGSFGVYFAGLLVLLAMAAVQFVLIIVARPSA
jgi:hypothetical protein